MNVTSTRAPGLTVSLTAHADSEGRLLLAEIAADESSECVAAAQVALVVDRSGSMSGTSLQACKIAVAAFVRSLRPEDRVAIVVYDDAVESLSPLVSPSETLARTVDSIAPGGSTNLYGGWLAGAKLLAPGGRVVLLSDGHANVGRYVAPEDLARQAGVTYERFRVVTSTVGIGGGYDERLMAGMAKAGGGGHYQAHNADAIAECLSRERYALGAMAQTHVSLRYGTQTTALSGLWAGETKRVVLRIDELDGPPATLRATLAATGVTTTTALEMPREFGHSEEATLEVVLQAATQAEAEAAAVRDPRAATQAKTTVRAVMLRLLAHPLVESELSQAVLQALRRTFERLERLERRYDEAEATVHRKRSFQAAHNLAERAKAYSSFDEDQATVARFSQTAPATASLNVDVAARALLPDARWAELPALPMGIDREVLLVALEDPRDGFLVATIEKETGRRVRSYPATTTGEAIRRALQG